MFFATVFRVKDFFFEPFASAYFAGYTNVGHELHRYRDGAFSVAFLAASSVGVEGEMGGGESHLL